MNELTLQSKGFVKQPDGTWSKSTSHVSKTCVQCGCQYYDYPSRRPKFCSLECAWKNDARNTSIATKRTKNRGSAVCKHCGVEFIIRTNGGTTFCSRRCASSHIGKMSIQTNRQIVQRTKFIEMVCPVCKMPFNSWASSKRTYCSNKCSSQVTGLKGSQTKHRTGWFKSNKPYSRARRGWRTIGGKTIWFRSKMEANYARFLEFSNIEWQYEPKTFWFDGIKRGVLSYTPDFFLPKENKFVETKGWMDAKSKTKLKRMRKYHPEVVVELVDWNRFRGIEKTVGKLINGWER